MNASDESALPRIGVLVLNLDGREWLAEVLPALEAQSYEKLCIYVVDNGSSDDSLDYVREAHPSVEVLRFERNFGYSMAYNLCVPLAFADGCEWVVLANNDLRLAPACLAELVDAAVTDPRIGVIGPAFKAWDGDAPSQFMRDRYPALVSRMAVGSGAHDVDWVEGSMLMMSRACWDSTGPLDPDFFFYWEDVDYCRRARVRGWRVCLAPGAIARHYGSGSATAEAAVSQTNALKTRNYFVSMLTDPECSISVNVLRTLRLAVSVSKQAVATGRPSIGLVGKSLVWGLAGIHGWWRKWQRDRAGGFPAPLARGVVAAKPARLARRQRDETE